MFLRTLSIGLLLASGSALAGPSEGRMMAYLEAQVEQQPNNPVHYLRRANGHAELGEWEDAFEDLTQVEQKGAAMAAALARGDFYQRLGKAELALEQFNRVLSAQPNNVRALIKRGRLLVELEQPKAAMSDYQRLFKVYPDADTGHYRQAAKLFVNQRQTELALALLDKRMQTTGPIPQLQSLAIDIEQGRGNYKAAIERMQSLHTRSKATPFWHVELAELQLKAGSTAQANRHLNIAADLLKAHQQTGAARTLLQRIGQLRQAAVAAEAPSRT